MPGHSCAESKAYQIVQNWKALGLEVEARAHMVKALSVDYAHHIKNLRTLTTVHCLPMIALACSNSIMIWYIRFFAAMRLHVGRSFWLGGLRGVRLLKLYRQ